uniref:Uncharacterized protein n=1 Tax=Strongyloides papillosus TaxID=174720 RepID=A0A0N5BUZ6_STREA
MDQNMDPDNFGNNYKIIKSLNFQFLAGGYGNNMRMGHGMY